MKKYLSVILTFLLLVSTLLINDNIKYYGLLSLFLFLPYLIHTVNRAIRKKLAVSDSYIGQEAKRQLAFFNSKIYRILILVPTVLLGIALFIFYIFLVVASNESTKLQNILLLSMSCALLLGFLWQFYLEIKK